MHANFHKKTINTYISVPAVGRQDLVLLVQIQNLNERQSVFHDDRLGLVGNRASHLPRGFVLLQEMLDETLLIRQGGRLCKYSETYTVVPTILRPLHLTVPSILRPAIIDTILIFST